MYMWMFNRLLFASSLYCHLWLSADLEMSGDIVEVRSVHLQAKVMGRSPTRTSSGRNAVAAAAYRAGKRLRDKRSGRTYNYANRKNVAASRIIAPTGAPEWVRNRSQLWNEVEASEKRKDAQVARELEISIPWELPARTRQALVWQFCRKHFAKEGMIADIALHSPRENEGRNHHAHVMLTTRSVDGDKFGKKNRDWNKPHVLEKWKDDWVSMCNRALAAHSVDVRLDRRSIAEMRKAAQEAAESASDWIEERRHLIEAARLDYKPRPFLDIEPYKAMVQGEPIPDHPDPNVPDDTWRMRVSEWKEARESRAAAKAHAEELERQLEIDIAASVADNTVPDQTGDLDDQALEDLYRIEVDATANEVDTASSEGAQESEDDVDYHQEAFEVIASMFTQPAQHLVARNNAATALLLHHPDWELVQSFQQTVSEVKNPFDVREVATVLNSNSRITRRLDDRWERFSDWDELFDVHDEIRKLGGTLAEEAQQGRSWGRVQKNIFAWAIEGIAETIKRAVNALAELIRSEAIEAKNRPAPPPRNADSGSEKPKPTANSDPQSGSYPKP